MRITVLSLVLFLTGNAGAQTAFEFLNLDVSARQASLAGSLMTGSEDPTAFYYNPALSVSAANRAVTFGFLKHVLDINAGYVFSTFSLASKGYFGVGIGYINYGTFTSTDEFGNEYGTFSAGDAMITLNYANFLGDNFSYGVNLKGIYSSIASATSTALAADVGLYYDFPDNLFGVGFSVRNIGKQLSEYGSTEESLPFDVRFGISKQLEHLPLTLSVALQRLGDSNLSGNDKLRSFVIGAEIALSETFHLRAGYDNLEHREMKVGLSSGIEGLSFGLGLKLYGYGFDYAFSSWGKIGALNRINVTTTF
ncbi:MAG TPA: type IX secretion system protein PorQ [Candidatus Kryptonia bacterium]